VQGLIDRGRATGNLEKPWSESTQKRVTSYVMGTAADFDLLTPSKAGKRSVNSWRPTEQTILYLAYDLHFLGLSDGEVVAADEWQIFGFARADVIAHLSRLEDKGHLTVQDSKRVCRIEWKYKDRNKLNHAILGRKN